MLRTATAADTVFLFSLYMHPAINRWLLYEEMPLDAFQPIAADLIARNALFIFDYDGQPAGMCKLVPQKYRNSHIMYLGGVAIHPAYKGAGLGRKMLHEAMLVCWDKGFTRIELTVAVENLPAIRLYESLGFVREGILKNYTYLSSEGIYIDEQVMALFHT
jgi:RimJ/RimL family protein N-acetyltransferase